ncbi:MAG: hypothetical protein QOG92_828, partial [Verrucomicrobiota bacterium]|nr:hypothetical protein [Verrucomicrobiota bacterium]
MEFTTKTQRARSSDPEGRNKLLKRGMENFFKSELRALCVFVVNSSPPCPPFRPCPLIRRKTKDRLLSSF